MYDVKLTYFKTSGSYYGSGEFEIPDTFALYRVWERVEEMMEQKRLPGLIEGHSSFIVLVDVPEHPHRHPHLIIPTVKITITTLQG